MQLFSSTKKVLIKQINCRFFISIHLFQFRIYVQTLKADIVRRIRVCASVLTMNSSCFCLSHCFLFVWMLLFFIRLAWWFYEFCFVQLIFYFMIFVVYQQFSVSSVQSKARLVQLSLCSPFNLNRSVAYLCFDFLKDHKSRHKPQIGNHNIRRAVPDDVRRICKVERRKKYSFIWY